ncbi:hypothetical protein BS78_02G234700 [Paspalum vaginatum]|nr:hypothetical protein BS78_02G234700 [Paspalum vaginatum]
MHTTKPPAGAAHREEGDSKDDRHQQQEGQGKASAGRCGSAAEGRPPESGYIIISAANHCTYGGRVTSGAGCRMYFLATLCLISLSNINCGHQPKTIRRPRC